MTKDPQHVQTNLCLFRQMNELGYSGDEIEQVSAAYRVAAQYFAGYYRAGWKPFICHLVGVSSALARHGARAELVAAGVVHSFYELENFQSNREMLRSLVGSAVETLVHDYTAIRPDRLAKEDTAFLSGPGRDTLVMRLCNVFDDLWALGREVAPDKALWLNLPESAEGRQAVMELATTAGVPRLAKEFALLFREVDESQTPFGVDLVHKHSFVLRPPVPSASQRARNKLKRVIGRLSGPRTH